MWYGGYDGYMSSWACGKIYLGCVKVRAFNETTKAYEYRWWAFVLENNPHFRTGSGSRGFYLLDLGEDGIFPAADDVLTYNEYPEYSSVLNLDANIPQPIKWFRAGVFVGPLYSPGFFLESSNRDSRYLRMTDYDEKLCFPIHRGEQFGIGFDELWVFHMPNEYNKYGFSWPLDMDSISYWSVSTGQPAGSTGTAISCKYFNGMGNVSNFVDDWPTSVFSGIITRFKIFIFIYL